MCIYIYMNLKKYKQIQLVKTFSCIIYLKIPMLSIVYLYVCARNITYIIYYIHEIYIHDILI